MFFARVPLKVMDMRYVVRRPGGKSLILLEEVHLPLTPLHCLQAIALKAQDCVSTGLLGVAQQEVTYVHSIDLPVLGYLCSRRAQQRRERIDPVDQFVADFTGRYLAWPADDAWRPVGTFQRGHHAAAPRSGEPAPLTTQRIRVHRR